MAFASQDTTVLKLTVVAPLSIVMNKKMFVSITKKIQRKTKQNLDRILISYALSKRAESLFKYNSRKELMTRTNKVFSMVLTQQTKKIKTHKRN